MKLNHLLWAMAALLTVSSCAKDTANDYNEFEDLSLKAWITQHRPELADNYQEFDDSGYYFDLHNAGDMASKPVNDTTCWIRFNLRGRDLNGNIILSRNARDAELMGTFTKYTHYTPYYMYCGDAYYTLMEGTWLALQEKQLLGDDYFAAKKDELGLEEQEYEMRIGSKVTLYMPSRVVGDGFSGNGGYEGQYSLDTGKPLIVEMEVCDTIKNPLQREALDIDAFCKTNGGLMIYTTPEGENGNSTDSSEEERTITEIEGVEIVTIPTKLEDENHPHVTQNRWVSACDSIAQLYVNHRFDPTNNAQEMVYDLDYNKKVSTIDNKYPRYGEMTYGPYYAGVEPYVDQSSLKSINEQIAAALKERFHSEEPYAGVEQLVADGADSVTLEGKAKIWYIGRFMDGFIFDTNIDEVKEIIYGEIPSSGSALDYTPEEGGLINAFYYAIPGMYFGQWGALITSSTHAYGASGQSGSTTSSSGYSSSYYDYMNYLNYYNYYNSYYGGYGYGGYGGYGGYYGNYYDSYYGNSYYNPYYGGYYDSYYGASDTTETVVTTTTEIPSYCPLIFEFYIEPAKK